VVAVKATVVNMTKNKEYTSDSIKVLDDISHIRLRPGLYVGGANSTGHFIILKEIIDNSIDEAIGGHATKIEVTISEDCRSAEVFDNGRGIPHDKHPKTGISTLATVFGTAKSGGKFDNDTYGTSVGTHGVGSTATNALSSSFYAESYRGKKTASVQFARGKMIGKDAKIADSTTKEKHGTLVRFTPDYEQVFKDVQGFVISQIEERLADAAHLLPKTQIALNHKGTRKILTSAGVRGILGDSNAYCIDFDLPVDVAGEEKIAKVSVAWTWGAEGRSTSLVNLSRTADGGQHASGWESALTDFLLDRCKSKCSAKEITDTLQYALHVSHPNPQFSSQTKEKLINKGLAKSISDAAMPHLKSWARKNASAVDAFLANAVLLYEQRQAQKDLKAALKDLKTTRKNSRGILPDKLFEADCKPYMRELYLVEGDSAAGSAVKGRNASFQEILPLKGKILNVFKASEADAIANDEIAAIVASVGGGFGARFNMSDVRIGKLIILSDSDHDGHHISSLIIGLLCKYMPGLLEKGMVYSVDAPLFKASLPGTRQRWFGHTMDDVRTKAGKHFTKCDVTRLKGHGEANPDEVREYAMANSRRLIQLKWSRQEIDDISRIMGDDISGRKELLGI